MIKGFWFGFRVFFICLFIGGKPLQGVWFLGEEPYRFPYLHSYFNLYYRFYQDQPKEYELGTEIQIPYGVRSGLDSASPQGPETLPLYRFQSSLGYTFVHRGIPRHRYLLRQNWYGDFLHVAIGYGLTHRISPLAFEHELPLTLGSYVAGWDFRLLSSLNWHPDFLPLFGGTIGYLFYSRKAGYFQTSSPLPHRAEITVYQTSPVSFGVRNAYWFSLSESPLTRLCLFWEVFPFRVGMAFQFSKQHWGQVATQIRYHPESGADLFLSTGVWNYRYDYYGNQIPEPALFDGGSPGIFTNR